MSPLEKCVRAVDRATFGELTDGRCEAIARAVLLAVRDEIASSGENGPVVSAGADFCQNHPSADAGHIASSAFLAMIDAILEGGR